MRVLLLILLVCGSLPAANYTVAGLQELPVTTTHIVAENFESQHIQALARFTKLESLVLYAQNPSAADWDVVFGLKSLRTLDVSDSRVTAAVICRVVELPNLESLKFRCVCFAEEEMASWIKAVSGLSKLRRLWFVEYSGPGAELAALGGLTGLTDLSLGAYFADDGHLSFLGKLTNLRRLELIQCNAARDATLEVVSGLASLDELQLRSWEYFTGLTGATFAMWTTKGIASLAKLKNLKTLSLHGSQYVTDDDLKLLSAVPVLEALDLSWCAKITDAGLANLAACVRLRHLDITGCGFRSEALHCEGFTAFAQHKALESIDIFKSVDVSVAGIAAMAAIPNLQNLNMRDASCGDSTNDYPDAAIKALHAAGKLRTLVTSFYNGVTPSQLQLLGAMKQLETLEVARAWELTDDSLSALAGLENLRSLKLDQAWHVTDAGLKHLSGLTRLEYLSIGESKITGSGLASLKALHNLRTLGLPNSRDLSGGLGACAQLPALEELYVFYSAGLKPDVLKGLEACPKLRLVGIERCDGVVAETLLPLAEIKTLRRVRAYGEGYEPAVVALRAKAPLIAVN